MLAALEGDQREVELACEIARQLEGAAVEIAPRDAREKRRIFGADVRRAEREPGEFPRS